MSDSFSGSQPDTDHLLNSLMHAYLDQCWAGGQGDGLHFLDPVHGSFLLRRTKIVHWGKVFYEHERKHSPLEIAAEFKKMGCVFREEVQPVLFFPSLDSQDRILILKLLPVRTILFEYRRVTTADEKTVELVRKDFYAEDENVREGGETGDLSGARMGDDKTPNHLRSMALLTKDELEELLDISFELARLDIPRS